MSEDLLTRDAEEKLVFDAAPNVELLMEEYQSSGALPNGVFDNFNNERIRRMIWEGQSPDGRRWDRNMPEGEVAKPWNGCSDTRVPLVDEVINDQVATKDEAFWRAELRVSSVNAEELEQASGISNFLHWLVHVKLKKRLLLEVELSAQFQDEYGVCIGHIGWEREIGKRRVSVTLEELGQLQAAMQQQQGNQEQGNQTRTSNVQRSTSNVQRNAGGAQPKSEIRNPNGGPDIMQLIADPSQEDAAVEGMQEMYRVYVTQAMAKATGALGDFYDAEKEDESLLMLKQSVARKYVRELRSDGETMVVVPFVQKNGPRVTVCKAKEEVLVPWGTGELQEARCIFWRRGMTVAQLKAKSAEGWAQEWIDAAIKCKGNLTAWGNPTTEISPERRVMGDTVWRKVREEKNPLIEVVYGYVRKVDEEGVVSIYETVFCPFCLKNDKGEELYAIHEPLDYAHGRYPFVELKRENLGRGLVETRSVGEVAGTWQNEEKGQRDMLFNRGQFDTLPAVAVPKLGGVDYRLGPGAQVPVGRGQSDQFKKLIELGAPPTLALELCAYIQQRTDNYFGRWSKDVDPAKVQVKQGKMARAFYGFWAEVFLHMFALTVQYNPGEIVKVTGLPELGQLDATTIMDEMQVSVEFDVRELNPDYLMKKMEALNTQIIPGDSAGIIDHATKTALQVKWLDPQLAKQIVQDKQGASQQVFQEVDRQAMRMALGNEAEYTENDATAPMKLQFMQQIMKSNPVYGGLMQGDGRFKALMENYAKNLQQSVAQQENKQIGRIGVKPVTSGLPAMGAGA